MHETSTARARALKLLALLVVGAGRCHAAHAEPLAGFDRHFLAQAGERSASSGEDPASAVEKTVGVGSVPGGATSVAEPAGVAAPSQMPAPVTGPASATEIANPPELPQQPAPASPSASTPLPVSEQPPVSPVEPEPAVTTRPPLTIPLTSGPLPTFEPESDLDLISQEVDVTIIRSRVRPVRLSIDGSGRRADLSVTDMQHNLRVFTWPYRRFFKELRIVVLNSPDLMPILALYRPVSEHCILGLNSYPQQWRRVTEKLNLFDASDDLTVFQEIAAAHEVGHCMAVRFMEGQNRRWTLSQRELFADVFAILHIREQFNDDEAMRQKALDQMVRFRAGGPPDESRPSPAMLQSIFSNVETEGVGAELGPIGAGEQFVERAWQVMQTVEAAQADRRSANRSWLWGGDGD